MYSKRHWVPTVPQARMQGNNFFNVLGEANNYLRAIENFNPNLAADIWRWIPQGLPYDLVDANVESGLVNDLVNGYTNRLCFNALLANTQSIQVFGNTLLQQNANLQSNQVRQLFTSYNYGF
jgi:hypothetical protein